MAILISKTEDMHVNHENQKNHTYGSTDGRPFRCLHRWWQYWWCNHRWRLLRKRRWRIRRRRRGGKPTDLLSSPSGSHWEQGIITMIMMTVAKMMTMTPVSRNIKGTESGPHFRPLSLWHGSRFSDGIASPRSYPCQWVSEWVIVSDLEIAIASLSFASLLIMLSTWMQFFWFFVNGVHHNSWISEKWKHWYYQLSHIWTMNFQLVQ